jgi:uncharacterized tellurite resistance protein B-like protein
MTAHDDTTALWLLDELWGVPPDVGAKLSDEENLAYGKALLTAAKGDGELTDAERDWILGYLTAAGHSEQTLAVLRRYDGEADVQSLFSEGMQKDPAARRFCIGDAIRACGADGDLAEGEIAKIHDIARLLDVPAEVVDEFVDIYRQEQALKTRRMELAFEGSMVR